MQKEIKQFLKEIEMASKQLKQHSIQIEQKETAIKKVLVDLEQNTAKIAKDVTSNFFGQTIVEGATMLQKYVTQWVKTIEQYMDGKDFINQFEKSVVIAVFGNVNTGKSSLGNFISGNLPSLSLIYNQTPKFYAYDFSEGNQDKGATLLSKQEFKEGSIETTASIQYFTLRDGLTWVDTPGIHSINMHNEELAKKYVDFADLILFLVPSSSPGKADEIEELSHLIEKKKSLLVAITKSDRITKDEVAGELVTIEIAKSEKDRQAQETYLANVLKEKNVYEKIKDAQFTSISVNLAKKALVQKNKNLFEDSGLPKLYKQIGKVLSSKAIELKMQRPIAQINSTIEGLISGEKNQSGLAQLKEMLTGIQIKTEQQKQNLQSEKTKIIESLASKSKLELDIELENLQRQFNAGHHISSESIAMTIENIILKHYKEVVEKRLTNLIADVHIGQMNSLQIAIDIEFEKKTHKIEQRYYDIETVNRSPRGIIEHIGSFFGKQYTESKVSSYNTTKTITIGNNFSNVLVRAQQILDEQVSNIVEKAVAEIEQDYFNQNEKIIQALLREIDMVNQRLQKLIIERSLVEV